MALLDYFKKQTNADKTNEQDETIKRVTVQFEAKGSVGTEIFSGEIEEEYLDKLKGDKKAEIYDEMRRGESQIKMVLSAVKNPIKSADWSFKPADDSARQKYIADFLNHIFMVDQEDVWEQKLHEILSCIDFGFSLFEMTHKIVKDHKRFGTYIGVEDFGWRSQKTIRKWNVERTGKLISVEQEVQGDIEGTTDVMGAEYLYVFNVEREGANYEGISMLRPCYGAWFRKKLFLKLLAIGIEKNAVPTPVGGVPEGKYGSDEYTRFTQVLEAYTSHEKQWITLPAGWTITFPDTKFEPEKTRNAINEENKEMVKAFLANFLELGLGSTSGSYSLSFDLSDFFLDGIEHVAKMICAVFNKKIIPDLVKINFGPQESYPTLEANGISDAVGVEFSQMMKNFTDAQIITPDDDLETEMRKRIGLPVMSLEGQRKPQAPSPGFFSEADNIARSAVKKKLSEIQFRESPRGLISDASKEMKEKMQLALTRMGKKYVDSLIRGYENAPNNTPESAVNSGNMSGAIAYRDELRDIMSDLAERSLKQAMREVKTKQPVSFAEELRTIRLAKTPFERLPKKIQKQINTRLGLIVETQAADVEKAVRFQFLGSVGTTDSTKIVRADLEGALDKYVESSSVVAAAGNTASYIVNDTRKAYFFEPSVLEEVQGFEFVNGDPKSDICNDLAGRTFSKDDAESERYIPPLHHNCKSYIVPILNGEKTKIDKEGLRPSSPDLESSITLGE